jgi:dTDP-4-amino-4,6-dideoxygalactose transaminase
MWLKRLMSSCESEGMAKVSRSYPPERDFVLPPSLRECLEERKIATRLMFGDNLVRQSAHKNVAYRMVGRLAKSDLVMNQLPSIGFHPGLTLPMLNDMLETIHAGAFEVSALVKSGAK